MDKVQPALRWGPDYPFSSLFCDNEQMIVLYPAYNTTN